MIKRLRDNIKTVATIVALLTIFSGLLWKGWSLAGQVQKNTEFRLIEEYTRLGKWMDEEEKECGEGAKNCSERRQDIFRRWDKKWKELNKMLGY